MDITKGATKSEIAAYYQISVRVLNVWLSPILPELQKHKNKSRYFTPAQMQIIINHIGTNE